MTLHTANLDSLGCWNFACLRFGHQTRGFQYPFWFQSTGSWWWTHFHLWRVSPLLNEFCSRHGFLGLQTILVCLSRCVHLRHSGDTGELGRHWIKTDTFWSCLCQDNSKRHSEYLGGSDNLYENGYRRVNLFRSQPLVQLSSQLVSLEVENMWLDKCEFKSVIDLRWRDRFDNCQLVSFHQVLHLEFVNFKCFFFTKCGHFVQS